MTPREILKKVRQLEIRTRRLVEESLAGSYHSTFRGRGMEFSEVREYLPGDDVRTIDWNVSARMNAPFIKQFTEERELTVMLLVDASASAQFGTQEYVKSQLIAEIAALIAFSAIRNQDRVGLLQFTDQIENFVTPKKGRRHVLRVLRDILAFEPEGTGTDIALALEAMGHAISKRAVVFIISDFQAPNFEKILKPLARKHDFVAIHLIDPREQELPPVGLIQCRDPETGEMRLLDSSSQKIRDAYAAAAHRRQEELEQLFRHSGVDALKVNTAVPYERDLVAFFKRRAKTGRGVAR